MANEPRSIRELLQSPATAPPALSPTSKKCEVCGKDIRFGTHCNECREKKLAQERYASAKKELPRLSQEQRFDWEDRVGIPGKFVGASFSNFNAKIQPQAFKVVNEYVWTITEDDILPKSLLLVSPDLYGVGKTHLVCALARKIIATTDPVLLYQDGFPRKQPCPVAFITEPELLARIRATYNRQENESESEEDVYRWLNRPDVLIVDDVGKVRPRDYSFLQGVWYRVIDYRYTEEKPIVLTTNLSLAELENHIGGSCADRLTEMCGKDNIVIMGGKSYRQPKPTKTKGE